MVHNAVLNSTHLLKEQRTWYDLGHFLAPIQITENCMVSVAYHPCTRNHIEITWFVYVNTQPTFISDMAFLFK